MSLKVSIITATFNSVETIEMCMNSVLNQTYDNIEYIIVDGNSNDGTLNLIKNKAKTHEFINWISEKDKGIYDALNKGVELATGDIVGFLHSDDFLGDENIIQSIVVCFTSHDVDGVYGDLQYVAKDNIDKIVRNWVSKPFQNNLLYKGWMPPHPTLYLKNNVYEIFGGFDLNFYIAADYDFILRIFKQTHLKFFYLPKSIVQMRVGGASNRSLKNILIKMKEDYRAIRSNQVGNWMTLVLKNVSKVNQFIK